MDEAAHARITIPQRIETVGVPADWTTTARWRLIPRDIVTRSVRYVHRTIARGRARALSFGALMLLLGASLQGFAAESQAVLVTYPEPPEVTYTHHNNDYVVKVRTPGGRWQNLFEYNVKVDLDKPQDASMVYFDFSKEVEVSVRKTNGEVRSVRIRPAVDGIRPEVKGNTVYFRLTQPRKLSIEFDGDRLHNLHLLANPLESARPQPGDPDVIYFGPGVHQLPAPAVEPSQSGSSPVQQTGVLEIPSGKTVYVAGGAILRGKLLLDHVHDVKIMGRGILEQTENAIEVDHSSRVSVEGLIVIDPTHYTLQCGESDHLEVRNLKTFSAVPWSDGIDMMSCSDVEISDVFLRTSDDCIAIYAHRWGFYGDSRHIRVSDSVLWADIAHPMTIGIHGDSGNPDTIEDIEYHNIDVLEHDERNPQYQGSMAINAGDSNLVRNVTYSDIRIDDFQEGQLVNLRVVFNHKYNTSPGRGVENITFRNILYRGDGASPSVIAGLDSQRRVRNVRFENLVVNGRRVRQPRDGNIEIGDFADNVRFVR